jgi:hypothetical protein
MELGYVNPHKAGYASWFRNEGKLRGPKLVYVGMATYGTDRQTGLNVVQKTRDMEKGRGVPETKTVDVCTDAASNMSSDDVGAAQQLVDWCLGAIESLCTCVYISSF